jgi:hypothetical protein
VTSNRVWSAEERLGHIKVNHDRLMKRWGGYLARRLEEDLEPEPLAEIKWEAEAASPPSTYRLVLYSARPLKVNAASRSLLLAAAALQRCCSVIIASDETYSRCRIYSLSREFGIELTSFALRRFSDLDPDAAELVVTFGAMPDEQLSLPHLAFGTHGADLLQLIDNMT